MPSHQPDGWHTVTPRVFVSDPAALVDWLTAVFDAGGRFDPRFPAEMRIGDSIVMVSGDSVREAMNACLYVYVPDADATYERAVAAGAATMEPPLDTPYGDRRAMVEDPWGNVWQIATRRAQ